MPTIATLLSGGECVGVGAACAGYTHLWGVEIDDAVAGVARANGFAVVTAAIQDADPASLPVPDLLHASPECQHASSAYTDPDADSIEAKETAVDRDVASTIVRYLEVLRPRAFTLENVWAYRRFQSFKLIEAALSRLGYFADVQHLNSADFGVAQTRRRLILRAVRGGLVPMLPAAVAWRGWYASIEDIVDTLPLACLRRGKPCPHDPDGSECRESPHCRGHFAAWQSKRLNIGGTTLVDSAGYPEAGEQVAVQREAGEPANTIVANHAQRPMRAFILGGQFGRPADGSGDARPAQIADADKPAFCVTAVNKGDWRAWLVDGQNARTEERGGLSIRPDSEPAMGVTAAGKSITRAWLMMTGATSSHEETRGTGVLAPGRPANTVARNSLQSRAWLSEGRIVRMTPRALARFQSIPDWYVLPVSNELACRVIGNGCPPLLMAKLYQGLLSVL